VGCDPVRVLLPDQAPEPEHEVALPVDQAMTDVPPASTLLGLALRVTTGANADTVTVADWVAEPPVPMQVSAYTVVLASASVDQVPLVATAPFQPPEAVQAVALVAFQFRLEVAPVATVAEEAVRVTSGAGEVTMTSAD
jgi:hypothetical protein